MHDPRDQIIDKPTFAKCGGCDDMGNVSIGFIVRKTRVGGECEQHRFGNCTQCGGVGFFGVPLDQRSYAAAYETGHKGDAVVIARARILAGLNPRTGKKLPNASVLMLGHQDEQ